jgi:hypothetical protein
MANLGTTNEFIANSKFTIMSLEGTDNPQLVLTQTKDNGGDLIWDNSYLQFKYSIDNENNSYFGITEHAADNRNADSYLNFELAGNLNWFNNTKNNTVIHSQYNSFNTSSNNNLLLNSNYNSLNRLNDSTFIKSTENEFRNINEKRDAETSNKFNTNTFVQSYKNVITLDNKGEENVFMSNLALLNSNQNYLIGYTRYNDAENNQLNKATLINNNNSYYHIKGNNKAGNVTIIGGSLNYVDDPNNFIGIGEGLLYEYREYIGRSDKIILGYYNAQPEDQDDFFIVGDGGINASYKNSLYLYPDGLEETLGNMTANNDYTSNTYYRHNLFTVNKNGYITVSNYQDPTQSARYGFDGITSNNIVIDYETLHEQMELVNGYMKNCKFEDIANTTKLLTETIDSYTPIYSFTLYQKESNVQVSAYLNCDDSNNTSQSKVNINWYPSKDYGIFNITYIPNQPNEGPETVALLITEQIPLGIEIEAYTTKQLFYQRYGGFFAID